MLKTMGALREPSVFIFPTTDRLAILTGEPLSNRSPPNKLRHRYDRVIIIGKNRFDDYRRYF